MTLSRRQFFKVCAAGAGTTSLALLGFSPDQALAEVRAFKLAHATETRNTCPYCSVGCGVLIYTLGDGSKNVRSEVIHVEGDPDHPVNRGTLCPKGAGLKDFIHSEGRLLYPEYRAPNSREWQRISWDEAFTRIAQTDEGGPRRQLHRRQRRRPDRQPLAQHRDARRLGLQQRDRLSDPQVRP
ncbi:MAG: hypothetical protein MZV65_03095 [Chromatiales bacterium]|nr:hypothetical protein [Chromatiales bacterium]